MTCLVNRLGHVALNVTDLDAAVADAITITGLNLVERSADRAVLTSGRQRAELVLHRARQDAVRCIGLVAPGAAEVEEAAARAGRAGWRILAERPSIGAMARAVTIASPEDHVLEIHTPLPEDQPRRHGGPGIHPRRLCHVNVASQDPLALERLLEETLGLRLSERTEARELVWMRAGDGRHHTVGIAKSAQPDLHHFAWEFAQFSDFMRLGDLLDTQDRMLVWGPGRHGCGDNLFSYYVVLPHFAWKG